MDLSGVAVGGMACRVPGAADLAGFWKLLDRGVDALAAPPPDRSGLAGVEPPSRLRPGGVAGFLDRIDEFDAGFFGIPAREAVRLDAQQRLLLETAWEAVEDAGVPIDRLAARTGVYAGCLGSDYLGLLRAAGVTDLHAHAGSGILGTPAGRLAYALDLRGPTMMVDASCSSGLLAVHLACAGLRSGEIDLALVAASGLVLARTDSEVLGQAGVLASKGRCRFGDADADGYVRSEGVVVVVLRRLADAVAAGNRVHAVLLGSAVTNDGRCGGTLFAPATAGQQEMLRRAWADAGVSGADVDYVEAHGAGTPVGDEVELSTLGAALAEAGRPADRPCLVGSVKSNVGHTEAAAGLVGLVKVALALRHRTIPATLHVRAARPVPGGGPVRLATERCGWPALGGRPRLAGVSSFGISGTNVHVVLAEAPAAAAPADPEAAERPEPGGWVLPLSARSPVALRELADRYARALSGPAGPPTRDTCHAAGTRRTHHPWRAAAVGPDRVALVEALRRIGRGAGGPGVVRADTPAPDRPRVAFVFPGQGWQTARMGRELLRTDEAFAATVGRCDTAIRAEAGWSVLDLLAGPDRLPDPGMVQPALWAVAVGLAASWRRLGVEPDLVIGHSMGEVAAATVSGALSAEDGAAVMCRRGRLLDRVRGRGGMAFVRLGAEQARQVVGRGGRMTVAACNGEHATVLAGDRDALAAVVAELTVRGVLAKVLSVDFAAHGPQVAPLAEPMRAALAGLRPRRAEVPMISTVHGGRLTGTELDAGYWVDNLVLPVRFGPAVRSLLADGRHTVFVEMSAHPQLGDAIEDALAATGTGGAVVGSLRRDEPEAAALRAAVARTYVAGCTPDWDALTPGGRAVELPHYPWQRGRYWPGSGAGPAAPRVDLQAGAPVPVTGAEAPVGQVREYLMGCVADLLQSPLPPDAVDRPLTALGLDSLYATRLRLRLEQELAVSLPVRQLLVGRTVTELAEAVVELRDQPSPAGR
jgi:acyl transferase domain-containing protein